MIPYDNCDKLKIVKLLFILQILSKANCNEDINIIYKKNSRNSKHKKNETPNNLSFKKNMKDKIYTECILPIQEAIIEKGSKGTVHIKNVTIKDDLEYILPIQEVNIDGYTKIISPKENVAINDDSECILSINEVPLENESKCILPMPEDNIENLISLLPIIVAEVNIDIPIESIFKLKNPALDIKAMRKDLYLTNSTLLPMYENHDVSSPSFSGKLFLEGFVRNKLDFSIAKAINDNIINLDTESVIIYIPFKGTTLIQYKVPPVFSKEKSINESINCNTPPIQCEIKEYKISETYTLLDKEPFNKDFPIEINFHTIEENIIINLSLTLLQEQDVDLTYNSNLK